MLTGNQDVALIEREANSAKDVGIDGVPTFIYRRGRGGERRAGARDCSRTRSNRSQTTAKQLQAKQAPQRYRR